MERLTERDTNGTAMAACCGENCKHNFCCENGGFAECGDMDDIIDRLAAYEDTGLEPEEIVEKIGWLSPICIGCPGKTEDGKRTELCGEPDDLERCVEQSKRLAELAWAALRREQNV